MEINFIGKVLLFAGLTLVLLGVLLIFFNKVPLIGKLPGDILIKKENFTFYLPITTSIILSFIISAVLLIFKNK